MPEEFDGYSWENLDLVPSSAEPNDIEMYCYGACHCFAVALHRLTGWHMHAVLDEGEPYWQSDSDADNYIASVVHVLVEDAEGNFWDVRGKRPRDSLSREMEDWATISQYGSDDRLDEDGLRMYVGYWTDDEGGEEIDRPLYQYGEDDIHDATEVARRVLAGIPGLEMAAAPEPASCMP